MRALDVMQEIRSGTIRQFQVQRDEIDAVVIEDGQGCACILRSENVEVLPEDLCEGRARGGLIIDDQDCWFRVGVSGTRVEGIVLLVSSIPSTGQGNRVNTRVCTRMFEMGTASHVYS